MIYEESIALFQKYNILFIFNIVTLQLTDKEINIFFEIINKKNLPRLKL